MMFSFTDLNQYQVVMIHQSGKILTKLKISYKIMPPKKQVKKEVIEEPPKEQEPQIPEHELHGFGKFEYVNGTVYEGNWRLFNGIKMKHGDGVLKVPGNSSNGLGEERYEGSWVEDKMQGHGVYHYACGAVYSGEWKNNKHHGKGTYEFPNGTVYEGEWKDHKMHGTGFYIDTNGRKWEGEYRNGKFETKRQKELLQEKQIELRKQESKRAVANVINTMLQALAKSDKKTFKENFSPFFAAGEVIKEQLKQPYAKFDERPQEKWVDLLNFLKSGKISVLQNAQASKFIGAERIVARQLEGAGQVVEVIREQERVSKAAFVNVEGNVWIVVATADEQKKK